MVLRERDVEKCRSNSRHKVIGMSQLSNRSNPYTEMTFSPRYYSLYLWLQLDYSDKSRLLGLREGSFDKKPKMNTRINSATTTFTTILSVSIDRIASWAYITLLPIIADSGCALIDLKSGSDRSRRLLQYLIGLIIIISAIWTLHLPLSSVRHRTSQP